MKFRNTDRDQSHKTEVQLEQEHITGSRYQNDQSRNEAPHQKGFFDQCDQTGDIMLTMNQNNKDNHND